MVFRWAIKESTFKAFGRRVFAKFPEILTLQNNTTKYQTTNNNDINSNSVDKDNDVDSDDVNLLQKFRRSSGSLIVVSFF